MASITALATSAHSSTDLSNPFGSEPSNFKQIKSACVLPFYSFDGEVGNSPKIGIQISDVYPESWTDSYKELYKDVAN
ncbi:hypothetical protein ACTPEM_26710, partial [Clostridioides difficile]